MFAIALLLLVSFVAYWVVNRRISGDAEERVMISRLCSNVDILLASLRAHYPDDPRTERLISRWSASRLRPLSNSEKQAAKTIDKRDVYICLKDERGRLYDDNVAMFVLVHELAHVASDNYGHDETFWKNNKFLLHVAHKCGVYHYEPYERHPVSYCGQSISRNPYTACHDNKQCDFFT